jgi:hypothetical protein
MSGKRRAELCAWRNPEPGNRGEVPSARRGGRGGRGGREGVRPRKPCRCYASLTSNSTRFLEV